MQRDCFVPSLESKAMKTYSYADQLACILARLPDSLACDGIIRAIYFAYAFGYANTLWGKATAVRFARGASMERAAGRGKGSQAARRLSAIRAARLGIDLNDWMALEADMSEMSRDEARNATEEHFESLRRISEITKESL